MPDTSDARTTIVLPGEREPEIYESHRGHGLSAKTLISRGLTETRGMTVGTIEIEPGGELARHDHPQDETYLVVEGTASVEVADEVHRVGPGGAVYIPGGCPHACRNAGEVGLRVAYFFGTDSIDDVEYHWGSTGGDTG